jgi:uncharacterized membrane protein YhaH (DUF805 family)
MSDIQQKGADEIFCSSCGAIIKKEAEICPKCGVRQKPVSSVGVAAGGQKMSWHYFTDALKKYAIFSGRARRAEFWWYCLGILFTHVMASLIGALINFTNLSSIIALAYIIPSIAVAFRRMHDIGKSGPYCFIPVYSIILAAQPGIPGPNQYGPDPKEV